MGPDNKPLSGKIAGGHLLAKAMADKGITRIFSVCGGFINPVYMGCMDYGIEVIGCRNELEAGFMAAATARLTREPAVCLAEPSGFTNYISAVAEAFYVGDSVIFVSASSNCNNFDNAGFKEMPQPEVVRCMSKYAIEVNDASRIAWFFDKAYDIAINQPTGPVQLTIPTNFLFSGRVSLEAAENQRSFDPTRRKVHKPAPNPDDLEELLGALAAAKKPVILAGPGTWYAHAEGQLEALSSKYRIPVFVPVTHVKLYDMTHPTNMGIVDYHQNPCSRLIGEEADLILFLGGRLDFPLNFGEAPLFNPASKMIAVNATARELSNNMLVDMRICSDVQVLLKALLDREDVFKVEPEWLGRIAKARAQSSEPYREVVNSGSEPVHPVRVCYAALKSLGEDDIMVIDGGDIACWFETALGMWAAEGHKIKGILSPGPWEQMGTGPAYATAAKMAFPKSRVVLVTGDGSLGLSPGLTPLETSIDHDAPVTILVANNAQWGMIQEQQKEMWGRVCATSLREVNYAAIFESGGAYAERVDQAAELEGAIRRALEKNSEVSSLIDIQTQGVKSPLTQGMIEMRVKTAAE
ncbi:MAG: thiamine pyrophosphate-binding protein [Gammaproteobacteria bacterium]|nr:thiamine pyrophosphate-binding protein [Gammaproteobacteria bacterium]